MPCEGQVSDITATIEEHRAFYKNKAVISENSPTRWKNDGGTVDISDSLSSTYTFTLKGIIQGIIKLTFATTAKEDMVKWETLFDITEV